MASVYKEGGGWAARARSQGQTAYQSGFRSQAAAQRWAANREVANGEPGEPLGLGPQATILAVALRDYAEHFVAYQKGAKPAVTRINVYLVVAGLAPLAAVDATEAAGDQPGGRKKRRWYRMRSLPKKPLPRTFGEYRNRRLALRADTQLERPRLAVKPVARIATHHVQALVSPSSAGNSRGQTSDVFHLVCLDVISLPGLPLDRVLPWRAATAPSSSAIWAPKWRQ